jgi:hypothetical protein
MKDFIMGLLRTRFPGVHESLLIRECEKIAPTVTTEEEAKTAVESVGFAQILKFYGDQRANDAQITAVKNYETKFGLKDGQKVGGETKPETKPTPQNDVPEWAKTYFEQQSMLMNEVLNLKNGKVADTRKQQLLKAIPETLPEAYRNSILKNFEKMSFSNDDDFTNYCNEVKMDTDSVLKEFTAKGAIINPPGSGDGKQKPATPSKEDTDEVLNKLNI